VRHDRRNAGFLHARSEQRDLLEGEFAGAPLAGRLRKNLQRLAARRASAIDSARQSAGNGEVGA
jgi:hypothetical protein